jgi:WD40 repeat protein
VLRSFCINPRCPQPDDPANAENLICRHCGSSLILRDRYRVTNLLSDDSGFAAIYEVSDGTIPQILKVLKSHHNKNLRAVELFKQEAVILSQLQHPGIPKVETNAYFAYLAHHNPEPIHCFVMEKIEGPNLQQWLRQQTELISEKQALLWLREIAEILNIVHHKNYFHRDIKLQNIMLRPTGQLVLIDFGAAREMTYTYLAQIGSAGKVTKISSAGYTPPEQEKGHAVPQSDFYALGRTFVSLLTGKQLTDLNIYNPLTDEFNWRSYAPQISPEFADFMDCLMSPKAINRPKDTEEVIEILNKLLGQSTAHRDKTRIRDRHSTAIQAQQTTLLQKPRRSRSTWIIGGAAAIVLAISGGYASWYAYQTIARPIALENLQDARQFVGHSSTINSIVISADQKILISASADKTIKIWNLETGELLKTLTGHTSFVNYLAISPDGQILASASADKTVKLWDLNTGKLLKTLTGHNSFVHRLLFSPDGQNLYSADATIKIWNIATGEEQRTLTGHTSFINALEVSPDGKVLISGSADKTIKFWDLKTGAELKTLTGHTSYINALAMSPDGKVLASGSADLTIKFWDLKTGELLNTLTGHTGYINALNMSVDGQILVSSSADKTIRFWDFNTGKLRRVLRGYPHPIDFFDVTPDLKTIATGSHDRNIHIWQIK